MQTEQKVSTSAMTQNSKGFFVLVSDGSNWLDVMLCKEITVTSKVYIVIVY